jgi:ubiquinone/menaquinone biosynthesis C-methylase UbiE
MQNNLKVRSHKIGLNMKEKIKSNIEWKKWGEIDPLFGVASWNNKNKNGSDPWTDEDFYNLGYSDWIDILKHWELYGVNKSNCLEIGCGAGRITKHLPSYFREVYAIDVSEKMIEYAQKHMINNSVSFYISNGASIPLNDHSVFSVFSTHVFQHLDSISVARNYFKEIARVIIPGGTFMIHLPIYRWPSNRKLFTLQYSLIKRVGDIKANLSRLLLQLGIGRPIMRMLSFSIDFFYSELQQYGFEEIELSIFTMKSNNDTHPFIFARRKT